MEGINILHNLKLNGNQLLSARLETLGTAPTTDNIVSGRLIYNSGEGIKAPQYYDGSNWITLSRKGYFSDLPTMYIGKTKVTNASQTTAIEAAGFKITDGADTSVLTAGGGSKTISSLSVSYATSAGKVSNALSWSGYSSGSYDGSAAKSITIPTASSFLGTYDGRYLQLAGGTMSAGAKIYFNGGTEAWIEYDATNGMFKFSKGIYSLGQVCAGGTGSSSSSGGGTSYDRLDKWSDYSDDKSGYVLSALLGNDLNTRVKTLEGGSAMNITMGTVGADYAVTKITKSGTTLACATARFAPLDSNGKVSSAYLPSYVDDVIEGYYYSSKFYSDSAHTTAYTGESGKIYTDLSTNKTYRWGGSAYVEISASLAIGTTAGTAYDGAAGNTLANNLASLTTTVNNIKVYNTTITVSHSVANGASSRDNQTFTLNQSSAKTITVYDTWRPVVDNLTSTVATSSLSAKQGKVLKGLVDAKPAEYRYSIAGSSSNTTKTYTPDQTFNAQPAVSLWDASGNLVLTDIKYDSSTKKLTVSFASAPTQNYTLVAIGN